MRLLERVMQDLEADKANYRHIFFNPNTQKIFLVKERYRLYVGKKVVRHEVKYYDGKIFGLYISEGKTTNWHYVGDL